MVMNDITAEPSLHRIWNGMENEIKLLCEEYGYDSQLSSRNIGALNIRLLHFSPFPLGSTQWN